MGLAENINREFEVLNGKLNGSQSASLLAVRQEALAGFNKLGIPSNRHEEWKYTNIKTNLPESLSVTGGKSFSPAGSSLEMLSAITATRLVFVNGVYSAELSKVIAEDGVTVGSLKEVLEKNKEVSDKYYGKLVKKYEEHFSLLNTAFAVDGAYVHIKKNTVAAAPVFIIHLFDSAENFIQSRNLIVAEEGSNANVVVDFQNLGAASFYNHVSEIFVGDNAQLNVTKLQTETKNTTAVHTLEAEVGRDATFACTTISFEGKLIRNSSNVRMNGQNSHATLNGLYVAKGDTLIDNHILIDHIVPNCQSNQLYKGVLDEAATGVFNGKIFVKPDAQKTNAFQSSKAVLLSDDSSMNSKPQLEIFADDVKCSHGAAIGQLNENELFYLQARGITAADAKSILTYAFANELIETVQIPELKQYLDQKLKTRLGLDF